MSFQSMCCMSMLATQFAKTLNIARERTGRGWKAAALTSSSALGSTRSSSMAGDTRTTSRMVCTGTIDCPSLARLRSSARCRLQEIRQLLVLSTVLVAV